ncbi:hypothetical protein ACSDR0_13695 [Streptosporangium sp. G11]
MRMADLAGRTIPAPGDETIDVHRGSCGHFGGAGASRTTLGTVRS